ncbi:sugar phosphate isomerase/epimerase [Pedobacter sp. CG_S7]|uniref:sugar phosphate isomerase/epimerase family protein n=1 Tax=Pedobacter sp. CG_S7 TaxID=3143930 RepID=UPI003398177A
MMEIKFYVPRWGNRHSTWLAFLEKVKQAGYDGIEANLPADQEEREEMLTLLKANQLEWIGQHFETTTADFVAHAQQYEFRLYDLAVAKPLFINSQTGKDFFSQTQNVQLIEIAERISKETGVTILHETHRGKFSFCTSSTAFYLDKFPDLKLTADFSHWCCVAESYLQDQRELVWKAISRTQHFHCRVGYPGGPQVNHPAAPEWKEALGFHLEWWDAIIQHQLENKAKSVTITCEFGPFPYMQQLPFTQEPLSSLWDINLFMKALLKERYL